MRLSALANALIRASEKAANLARVMRSDKTLFDLLVEEKLGDAKNKRFTQDFKTLGDVLVQEMVRHDLAAEFPGIGEHIYGEESNKFTNTVGQSLEVEVLSTQAETSQLLEKVLDGNHEAASLMADTVHKDIPINTIVELEKVKDEVDTGSIGIWIDPIDSTAQFIHGYTSGNEEEGVHEEGLQCVVIIIGVYSKTDGLPIIGVCNQPFCNLDSVTNRWIGRCLWGLCYNDTKLWHIPNVEVPEKVPKSATHDVQLHSLVMSSSETQTLQDRLRGTYNIRYAAGAGYKIVCVLDRLVEGYILSSGSTFKWDTCGPHAIIRSMGGGILSFKGILSYAESKTMEELRKTNVQSLIEEFSLRYLEPDPGQRGAGEKWSNSGGLLAFVDPTEVLNILCEMKQ